MHEPVEALDVERTLQATERTFLAYIRTSINIFAVGVTLIKFFNNIVLEIIGFLLIPFSLIIFLIGYRHYRIVILHLKKTNLNRPKN
jgi:uncharacterized membrane protein YidH (DUF202 family)